MKKPVPEMTPEEYRDYITSLPKAEFMNTISHDAKGVLSVAHGYISLLRLDVEEDLLNAEQIEEYIKEMENMLFNSYKVLEAAEEVYRVKYKD